MEPKKNPSKDVHRYSKQYFLIGLIISCSVAIMAFEWETEITKTKICNYSGLIPYEIELYPVPVTAQPIQPAPVPLKKTRLIELANLIPVDSYLSSTDDQEPEIIIEPVSSSGTASFISELEKEIAQDTFILVETMPQPIGGYKNFYKELAMNIKYPSKARNTNAEGRVFVEFIINELGIPVNMKIIKGIGYGCDEEAKRVIAKTKWEPGKQRGRPALVRMVLPVYFNLE